MTVEKFNELVQEHADALFRLAYRILGRSHLAEDAVQDTFRSIWKGRDNWKDRGRDRTLLCVILRRRIADMRRKQFPQTLSEVELPGEFLSYHDELSTPIQHALDALKPTIRETFLLVVLGELSHAEVAEMLQVPLGTVLSRVSRARTQLREALQHTLISS